MLIEYEKALCRVLEVQHITPGNLRAHVRCRMRDIRNGRLLDHKFRAEDDVQRATLDEHEMQFLYREGDLFHFMNTESYEQIHISLDVLGDNAFYMLPDSTISVAFFGEEPVDIHLPVTVDLKVADTVPGIKGATASAQIKPATLETGLVVNVPSFIETGETVRVSTETGEYLGRA